MTAQRYANAIIALIVGNFNKRTILLDNMGILKHNLERIFKKRLELIVYIENYNKTKLL